MIRMLLLKPPAVFDSGNLKLIFGTALTIRSRGRSRYVDINTWCAHFLPVGRGNMMCIACTYRECSLFICPITADIRKYLWCRVYRFCSLSSATRWSFLIVYCGREYTCSLPVSFLCLQGSRLTADYCPCAECISAVLFCHKWAAWYNLLETAQGLRAPS